MEIQRRGIAVQMRKEDKPGQMDNMRRKRERALEGYVLKCYMILYCCAINGSLISRKLTVVLVTCEKIIKDPGKRIRMWIKRKMSNDNIMMMGLNMQ